MSERPYVEYKFHANETQDYKMHFHLAARNPDEKGGRMEFSYQINKNTVCSIQTLSDEYYTEWYNEEWHDGVINNYREISVTIPVKKGENTLKVIAGDAGIILDKIVIYKS